MSSKSLKSYTTFGNHPRTQKQPPMQTNADQCSPPTLAGWQRQPIRPGTHPPAYGGGCARMQRPAPATAPAHKLTYISAQAHLHWHANTPASAHLHPRTHLYPLTCARTSLHPPTRSHFPVLPHCRSRLHLHRPHLYTQGGRPTPNPPPTPSPPTYVYNAPRTPQTVATACLPTRR